MTATTGEEQPDLRGDYLNVVLLLLLYFMQGIPMGLSMTLDLMLQEGGRLPFEEQGIYSAVSWPYSLKMLWAPIVDSFFLTSVGRRKTWLLPTQFLIGVLLFYASGVVPELIADNGSKPQVVPLTILFFTLYLLAATQDIAVDGWALELLQKRNLGWASTCNAIGLTAGYTASFTGLMALKSYDLCDLPLFMRVSAYMFLLVTFLIWQFKTEKPVSAAVSEMSVLDSYKASFMVINLPSVRTLIFLLLTRGVATAAGDTLSSRVLLGKGMKKESLAGIMALLTPIQMILPGVISPYTASKPLRFFAQAYPLRMILVVCGALLVWCSPDFQNGSEEPTWFYAVIFVLAILGSVASTIQFVSLMAFFAKVSDPAMGGSYMTILNTATNMGAKWPSTLVLFLIGPLTTSWLDGYYVLIIATLALGTVWFAKYVSELHRLEQLPESKWRIIKRDDGAKEPQATHLP